MYLCKKSQSRIILQITIQITTISLPAMAKDKQGRVSTTNWIARKRKKGKRVKIYSVFLMTERKEVLHQITAIHIKSYCLNYCISFLFFLSCTLPLNTFSVPLVDIHNRFARIFLKIRSHTKKITKTKHWHSCIYLKKSPLLSICLKESMGKQATKIGSSCPLPFCIDSQSTRTTFWVLSFIFFWKFPCMLKLKTPKGYSPFIF